LTGKLYIVGVGPGHHDHMTFRAKEVIIESDTIVGYETYVNS
jgi:precorrin-3B C17-methyltransferase